VIYFCKQQQTTTNAEILLFTPEISFFHKIYRRAPKCLEQNIRSNNNAQLKIPVSLVSLRLIPKGGRSRPWPVALWREKW
jgi:hypothetical protein